jgi:hypothetical protein
MAVKTLDKREGAFVYAKIVGAGVGFLGGAMGAEVGRACGGGSGRGEEVGMEERLIVLMMVAGLMPVRAGLRRAVFDSDATPPVGTRMSYDPMLGVGKLSLRCRGVVLTGAMGRVLGGG